MNKLKMIVLVILLGTFVSIFPVDTTASDISGIKQKFLKISEVYSNGSFFTSDGTACKSSVSERCRLCNIPSRGNLPSGREVGNATGSDCYSCKAFGAYVFYCVFGEAYFNAERVNKPSYGDLVLFNGDSHTAIYLWEDSESIYVFDSNGDYENGVVFGRAFKKTAWRITSVYHAKNYDSVALSVIMPASDDAFVPTDGFRNDGSSIYIAFCNHETYGMTF